MNVCAGVCVGEGMEHEQEDEDEDEGEGEGEGVGGTNWSAAKRSQMKQQDEQQQVS